MNNLEISINKNDDDTSLSCIGRLDANSAGYLNDFVERLIQEGHYNISIDMTGIEYLSSAGIRSLVTQYRNLNKINGHFSVSAMSKNVKQVLEMVGMSSMLNQAKAEKAKTIESESNSNIVYKGLKFKIKILKTENKSNLKVYGNPESIKTSSFNERDLRISKAEKNHFSIGLGAIGDSFDDCKNLFGEFIMMGKDLVYLPSDGSRKPDYMISSGQLIATLAELYGLHFEGNFSHIIRFDPETLNNTSGISQITEGISECTKHSQYAFVMIAESSGIIGVSLNSPPVNGKKIFDYPEIKETINFSTEPLYNKTLTVSVGIVTDQLNVDNKRFLRPISPDSNNYSHIHTAVFPFIPLKKEEIDLYETTNYLIENIELKDILHLVNDSREIVGLGESQFTQGTIWVVPIESTELI